MATWTARSDCSAWGSAGGWQLALLVAAAPHLALLDEPTNHISLALAEELAAALGSAPGAVVVASHDRWLRRRWSADRVRLTAQRRLEPVSGSGW